LGFSSFELSPRLDLSDRLDLFDLFEFDLCDLGLSLPPRRVELSTPGF
jgi:hypothetical protein